MASPVFDPDDDPHADPHDASEVRKSRRLVAAWYLWPLGLLLAAMLIGWLVAR